jgi:hypothetical protein
MTPSMRLREGKVHTQPTFSSYKCIRKASTLQYYKSFVDKISYYYHLNVVCCRASKYNFEYNTTFYIKYSAADADAIAIAIAPVYYSKIA